jgi:hypothetical protein
MIKTLNLLCSLLLLVPVLTYAQKKDVPELKVKFGKISEEEIAMKQYDKDPDAAAVILFDKGYVSWGNYDNYERHIRIKIFKKEAYNRGDFRIMYSKKANESIMGLKASCYNMENGKLVETKATNDNIIDEELIRTVDVKKITIPGVKEGSIIELKYTLSNPSIDDWYFQDNIPTIWSEYEVLIPEYYVFSKIGQGFTPYAVNETNSKSETRTGTDFTYNVNCYRWVQKDVPAFKSEKFM